MLDQKIIKRLNEYVKAMMGKPLVFREKFALYNSISSERISTYIEDVKEASFHELLFQLIDEREMNDATVYKKALVDRRHFSKIRSNPNYNVGKNTVIALALALELNLSEGLQLIHAAGYALSKADPKDLVLRFCFENEIYNLHDVNFALDCLQIEPLL